MDCEGPRSPSPEKVWGCGAISKIIFAQSVPDSHPALPPHASTSCFHLMLVILFLLYQPLPLLLMVLLLLLLALLVLILSHSSSSSSLSSSSYAVCCRRVVLLCPIRTGHLCNRSARWRPGTELCEEGRGHGTARARTLQTSFAHIFQSPQTPGRGQGGLGRAVFVLSGTGCMQRTRGAPRPTCQLSHCGRDFELTSQATRTFEVI